MKLYFKSPIVENFIKAFLVIIVLVVFYFQPIHIKTTMLLSFFVLLFGVYIFHLLFLKFVIRKNEFEIAVGKSFIDLALLVLILNPVYIFIDLNVDGDYDILPQLILFWLSYSLLLRYHIRPKLNWMIIILNGINIGLAISLIWIITAFHIIDVKSNAPSVLTMLALLLALILTPVLALKLFFRNTKSIRIAFIILLILLLVLIILMI